jgi:hypothetical protein
MLIVQATDSKTFEAKKDQLTPIKKSGDFSFIEERLIIEVNFPSFERPMKGLYYFDLIFYFHLK